MRHWITTKRALIVGTLVVSVPLLLISYLLYESAPGAGEVSHLNPSGVPDQVRLENEDKLAIPLEKTEEVWSYLYKRYVEAAAGLKALDPNFSSSSSVEDFVDTYFDTPALQLLKSQSSVRHRGRTNETNPIDRKSGRELVQVKLNDISANDLVRGELKFEVEYPTKVKSADDAHPLIGIVKRSEREKFKQTLSGLGLDPYGMKPIVTLEQRRRRIYIMRSEKPFLSLSLDEVTSSKLWASVRFMELEPELNEITYTEADAATRKYMEDVNTKIIDELLKTFPYVHRDLTPKYNKTFTYLGDKLGAFKFLMADF